MKDSREWLVSDNSIVMKNCRFFLLGGGETTRKKRFFENGHYGVCSKEWFGWFNHSRDGIELALNDNSFCQNNGKCLTSTKVQLSPMDRPDIVPENGKKFYARVCCPKTIFSKIWLFSLDSVAKIPRR